MPYTRAGLVRAAQAEGFDDVSDRLLTEWARLGLIDAGQRTGRKDGKRGAYYHWPDNQLDLLLTLLRKRDEVRHTRALVVLPVGVWLYWGDEWIPIRQVRRALMTSTSLFGPPGSWERAASNAREVVRSLCGEGARRSTAARLQKCLTLGLFNEHLVADELRPLVQDVLLTDPKTGGWGPFGWDVDEVVRWLRVTVVAINRLGSVTDGDLVEARTRQRTAVLNYALEWRNLARLPGYGQMFEEPTLELLVNRSCRDLLSNLGMRLLADEEGRQLPPVPLIEWHEPPMNLIRVSSNRTEQQPRR